MTDTDVLFRRWMSDIADPDSCWEYGNGIPIAPDAKSFLAEFDRLKDIVEQCKQLARDGATDTLTTFLLFDDD